MKTKIIFTLISLFLTGSSLSPVQGLTLLARDIGFQGTVEIANFPGHGGQLKNNQITLDPWGSYYGYTTSRPSNPTTGIGNMDISGNIHNNGSVDILGNVHNNGNMDISGNIHNNGSQTLSGAIAARLIDMGQSSHLSNDWFRVYYAPNLWHEENK